MRTRRSNKNKSFLSLVLADDADSGDEDFAATGDKDESDVSVGGSELEEDVDDEGVEHDEADSDDAASDHENIGDTPSKRRNPPPVAVLIGQRRADCHELPVYPVETRNLTRIYTGELQRHSKYSVLRDLMYGPEYERVKLLWSLLERWMPYQVLPAAFPPKHPGGVLPSPWVPTGFEASQEAVACKWYGKYRADLAAVQRSHPMEPVDGQQRLPRAEGELITLLGPWDSQKEYKLKQGDGMVLSPSNISINDADDLDSTPTGWIFDVGGLVAALDWAPTTSGNSQILALAVVPHSDQVPRRPDDIDSAQEERKEGSIQFWGFSGEESQQERVPRPSRKLPELMAAKCFDWGRPKRLQWCPVSLGAAGICGMVAILCGDGRVRVLEVEAFDHSAEVTQFEWIESPIATLGVTDDYNIQATCLTWVGINRLALGHSDGTITLWSIYPCQLLQRHGVHTSFVIDISSGYPSHPYLVASVPVGGLTTLTDLTQPSSETTYVPAPTIALQPGLLSWNDHMQGWITMYASPGAGVTTLAFLSARYFCQPRTMSSCPSAPMSISAAGTHPFVLVGCADGSLWSFNALTRLFRVKEERTYKMKVAEHEFRATDVFHEEAADAPKVDTSNGPPPRGASRILQGFLPVVNGEPRTEKRLEFLRKQKAHKAKPKSGKRRGRPPKIPRPAEVVVVEDEDEVEEVDDEADYDHYDKVDPRFIIHDPLTRVTAVAWNPNAAFGCWAAVAFGSGLVRLMDVGVE